MFKIGFGFDTHKLVTNKRLIIGGIHIPYNLGCEGYSDADVLIHAICDALLGATNMRDIGYHFPDTDIEYKDKESSFFLIKVCKLITKDQWRIENIDTTIVIQQPKISSYIPSIQEKLSTILQIETNCISIKAKTSENIGFIGREEGISAYAVALLAK
jgi:2-C-methyl-D-erythritol 2,4-cyclodiphosphate synthase